MLMLAGRPWPLSSEKDGRHNYRVARYLIATFIGRESVALNHEVVLPLEHSAIF